MTEEDSANITRETLNEPASYETPSSSRDVDVSHRPEDLDLSSLAISSHGTPHADQHYQKTPNAKNDDLSAVYSSPYENLRKQVAEEESSFNYQDTPTALPSTPGKPSNRHDYPDVSSTPTSSPLASRISHGKPSTAKNHNYKPSDPVLHHVLDKTYRVQATPHGKSYGDARSKIALTPKRNTSSKYPFDDSPPSSPEPEAPQLHTELFSPMKTPGTARRDRSVNARSASRSRATPKPGISVMTPAKYDVGGKGKRAAYDSDDDFDYDDNDELGASPPKTMQFHIPQSRLVKTPGRFSKQLSFCLRMGRIRSASIC